MFVQSFRRQRPVRPWATPLLAMAMVLVHLWLQAQPLVQREAVVERWGALVATAGERLTHLQPALWQEIPRLFTALFLHTDWLHVLGNAVFLLIFGLSAERSLRPWRFLLLFLLGGAVANAVALVLGAPDQLVIGASGAISAIIGVYVMLFPGSRLGVVLPLGLFLQFVRVPAFALIGVWIALQLLFAWFDPSYGAVAWIAHVAGLVFGMVFALLVSGSVRRRR